MGSPSDEELDNLKIRVPFDTKIFDQFKGHKKIPLEKNLKDKTINLVTKRCSWDCHSSVDSHVPSILHLLRPQD